VLFRSEENPSATDFELEFARIWKALPKIVFSKTLEKVAGNARLVRDGVGEEVARLKEQTGRDLAVGGAGLASALMKLGLIDEYRLFVSPAVLGGGTPYFPALEKRINMMMDEGQERVRASYRENYDRLTRVKAQYDPDNLFRVNQNIEPA
jgi:dihydrofolate reductase